MLRMIKSLDNGKYEYEKSCRSFMILSLFFWISEICCLPISNSVDKLVPFSYHKIINYLPFMEGMDHLRVDDMMNSF